MLHSLPKFKKILTCLLLGLCLAVLLCPAQAQAAENVEVTVKSPTNPDHIFTGDEVYDLTVYLQGAAGETYNVSYQVIDGRKLTLVKSKEPISVALSGDGAGELLLDFSSVKGRDNFRVEVTVTDGSGATVGETSCTFSRVNIDSVFSAVANARDGVLFSIEADVPDLNLYLKKDDSFPETLIVTYWITDLEGRIIRQVRGNASLSNKDYTTIPLNFHGLETLGRCRISYIIYDDTHNLRASGSSYFEHYGSHYIQGSIRSEQNKVGLIFANDEPYDLVLDLRKIDYFAESFTMRYTVTGSSGNVVTEFTGSLDLPEKDVVTVPLDLSKVTGYDIFTLTATATDANGNESSMDFSFSRVLSTAEPGALPLVNINDHFTTKKGDAIPKLNLSAQAGFGLWRACVPWASVEKQPGNYSMPTEVEKVLTASEELGMEPFLILAYGNDTIYGQPDPTNAAWLEAYAGYCTYLATYFGDRVNHYEVWNEWNHASMGKTAANRRSGNYYAIVLAAASKAIKAVNPNATVIGGAMAGHDEGWMVAMLSYDGNGDGKSDAMEAMDGFSFHTYATDWKTCFYSFTEHNYARDFQEVIDVLNRYGDASTKEIWMTETGWSTCIGPGVTEEIQAAYMVQMYTWALANPDMVDRIFWYDLMNDCDTQTVDWDPYAGENNWGLIHNWTNAGDEPMAYSAKKSYIAMCAMVSLLADATDGEAYELGDGIYAYRFRKDGQNLLVAWMDGESKTLNLGFSGDLVVTDLYGNAVSYTGNAALTVSDCPIYITYSGELSIG